MKSKKKTMKAMELSLMEKINLKIRSTSQKT